MTKPAYKNVIRVANCFTIFLIIKILEDFLIVPKLGINIHGAFSCVVGFVAMLVYMRIYSKSFEDIGLWFSRRKVKKGVLVALLINVIAIVAVYPIEYLYRRSQGFTVVVTAYYEKASNSFSSGSTRFLIYICIAVAVSVIHALFYELAFRGLFMRLCTRTFSFSVTNILQASLYTIWFCISFLRVVAGGSSLNVYSMVMLLLFILVYEFTISIKLGLLKRASGSLWLCIFDHLIFGFVTDVIHFQCYSPAGNLIEENSYLRLIAYAFISLFVSYIYYNKRLGRQQPDEADTKAEKK